MKHRYPSKGRCRMTQGGWEWLEEPPPSRPPDLSVLYLYVALAIIASAGAVIAFWIY